MPVNMFKGIFLQVLQAVRGYREQADHEQPPQLEVGMGLRVDVVGIKPEGHDNETKVSQSRPRQLSCCFFYSAFILILMCLFFFTNSISFHG